MRVWLPDRPGALGQVASRVGAVRGDVTAIDILERGGGRVVDELVVELPADVDEGLLVREISAVDGVAVEHIRPIQSTHDDPAIVLLAVAATVAAAPVGDRADVLVQALVEALEADWTALVAPDDVVACHGDPTPDRAMLLAVAAGRGHLDGRTEPPPGDVVWAPLPTANLTIVAARSARALHERERSRLHALARLLDHLCLPVLH